MPNAKDIAMDAYQLALDAAEQERLVEEGRKEEETRKKFERHQETFDAAMPILNSWFPGVEWTWEAVGDFGHDVIVYDASENQYPPSFKLLVNRFSIDMNTPDAGYRMEFEVGDYKHYSSAPDYTYFSGTKVKSAADIGRYLKSMEKP